VWTTVGWRDRNGNQSIADMGTASVLDYRLDAAGECPTAVSVTWL